MVTSPGSLYEGINWVTDPPQHTHCLSFPDTERIPCHPLVSGFPPLLKALGILHRLTPKFSYVFYSFLPSYFPSLSKPSSYFRKISLPINSSLYFWASTSSYTGLKMRAHLERWSHNLQVLLDVMNTSPSTSKHHKVSLRSLLRTTAPVFGFFLHLL